MSRFIRVADIVQASDIAARMNVTGACVSQWRSRHPDFPEPLPIGQKNRGTALWDWQEVSEWLRDTGRTTWLELHHGAHVEALNCE
jgi:hypothetical protein